MYRLKSLYCCLCALLLVLSDNERNAVCLNTQKKSRLKGSFLALTYPMSLIELCDRMLRCNRADEDASIIRREIQCRR